ncbi:MAG: polymer-forming cytoskeletal protein, partial [Betaproteobacteria bacterium]
KGGMLVVSETGVVEGEVRTAHLVVAGRINGPVMASELVELQPKARVNGDVLYRALEMHHGAIVEGRLTHDTVALESSGRGPAALKLAAAAPRSEAETAWSEPKTGAGSG